MLHKYIDLEERLRGVLANTEKYKQNNGAQTCYIHYPLTCEDSEDKVKVYIRDNKNQEIIHYEEWPLYCLNENNNSYIKQLTITFPPYLFPPMYFLVIPLAYAKKKAALYLLEHNKDIQELLRNEYLLYLKEEQIKDSAQKFLREYCKDPTLNINRYSSQREKFEYLLDYAHERERLVKIYKEIKRLVNSAKISIKSTTYKVIASFLLSTSLWGSAYYLIDVSYEKHPKPKPIKQYVKKGLLGVFALPQTIYEKIKNQQD